MTVQNARSRPKKTHNTPTHHSRAAWEQRYRGGETGWDRGGPSPMLEAWLDAGELVPSRVIIPGAGYGHEVVALAQRGFEVTAIDFVPDAVDTLTRTLSDLGLGARVVNADILQWQPDEPVDVVYEQTCLCAIAPADRASYAEQLANWLEPGGNLFALFMQCPTLENEGPPYDCPLPEMRELFSADTWHWPSARPTKVPHPTGLHELGVALQRI